MANFEKIVPWILWQEDDHKNPGRTWNLGDGVGLTRLGITQRWHQQEVPLDFFSTMPFKQAVAAAKIVYRDRYWNLLCGDLIQSDYVAAPLLSFAVNDNVHQAAKTLQHVLGVTEDGSIGPKTIAELNSKDPRTVSQLFRINWIDFYEQDAKINQAKTEFLTGWINRAKFPYPAAIPGLYN